MTTTAHIDLATLTEEDANELAAFRSGAGQLAYDPITPQAPRIVHYDRNDEPMVYVQRTYRGVPTWICYECLRITVVAADDVNVCHGCGWDDLSPDLHPDRQPWCVDCGSPLGLGDCAHGGVAS